MARRNDKAICTRCRRTFSGTGSLCPSCKRTAEKTKKRESSYVRGYDHRWKKIREEVLAAAGIPIYLWPCYAVDHNPPYNPQVEPNHRKYTLIPREISEHNRKTATEDIIRDHKGRFASSRGRG